MILLWHAIMRSLTLKTLFGVDLRQAVDLGYYVAFKLGEGKLLTTKLIQV